MIKKLILKLTLSSFNSKNLVLISNKIKKKVICKKILGPIYLPLKIKKFCVLRSPFKHKDSRDQFEIRFFKTVFFINLKDKFRTVKFFKTLFNFISFEISKDIFYDIKYL